MKEDTELYGGIKIMLLGRTQGQAAFIAIKSNLTIFSSILPSNLKPHLHDVNPEYHHFVYATPRIVQRYVKFG